MQARIIAIIILSILLGIPLFLYWYFLVQKESILIITPSQKGDYSVELHGTLEYGFLPLADKFLVFKEECQDTCTLGALPPVKYRVVISSTGNVTTENEVNLTAGESYVLKYEIQRDIQSVQIDINSGKTPPILPSGHKFLSYVGDNALVYRKTQNEFSLGFLIGETYRPMRQIPREIKNITMDKSQQFILLEGSNVTVVISKDLGNEIELPVLYGIPSIVTYYNKNWKTLTSQGVFEKKGTKWEKNIRFSDYIDVSKYERIGYIAPDDTERLSLSNFPSGEGVMIFLNRKTGKSYTIKKGVDIGGFFYAGDKPAYLDDKGGAFTVEYTR